jgi:Ca2+-binding RTX toxin-like protein
LILETLELRTLLAADVVASITSPLTFETSGQSMWAPGPEAVASAGFSHSVIDESFSFDLNPGVDLPNPLAAAYDVAYTACTTLGFTDSQCRSGGNLPGLGERPNDIILGPAWDIAMGACQIFLSFDQCKNGISIGGLGNRPPGTLRTGLDLSASGGLEFGFSGEVHAEAGSVDVSYPTTATISATGIELIRPGETFTIHTSELPGAAEMITDFAEVGASLSAFYDVSANLDATGTALGATIFDVHTGFDTGLQTQELVAATVGDGALELSILGNPVAAVAGVEVSVFFVNAGLYVPSLDTAPPDSSSFDGDQITNTLLPVDRTGDGVTDIDFGKLTVDLDSLVTTAVSGNPVGFGVEFGGDALSLGVTLLNAEIGSFFGVGQTMTFDPRLMAVLTFNQPTLIKLAGDAAFHEVTSVQVPVGQSLEVIHPGDDLVVDTKYTIGGNVFSNDTDILASPAFILEVLSVELGGTVIDILSAAFPDLPTGFTVFEDAFPIGDPISIATIADTQFSLQGFADIPVGSLVIPSNVPPEIVPASIAVSPTPVAEGSTVTFSGAFVDPNVGQTHTVTITWGDGSAPTVLNVSASDPKSFAAEHVYADNGTYAIGVTTADDEDESDSASASATVSNVAPTVALAGSSLNLDAEGNPIPLSGVRGQALDFSGSFSDPGFNNLPLSSESFSYRIDYGDGTVTPWQPAAVNVVGSPGAPTTGAFAGSHRYANAGQYPITVQVRDDDGGTTELTKVVSIAVASPQVGGVLAVGGTTGNDDLQFSTGASTGQVEVELNDMLLGTYVPTAKLLAYGQAGDDNLQVAGSIHLPAHLSGDAGHDRLKGGGGHDVLLGGDGDDLLVGQSGRDLLLAGDGADRIVGNADDDLLIAGSLNFADLDLAIAAIMAEWTSDHSYATRIANLSGKTEEQGNADFAQRHNESYFLLLAVTVVNDDDHDTLTGSAGEDWFWFDPDLDKVTDLGNEAFADDLQFILT